MRIGIDLDGCAYDFGAALAKYLIDVEGFPEEVATAPKCWNFFLDWGMTLEQYLSAYARGVDAGIVLREGEPDINCVKVLNQLRADGHTLHIVTWRTVGKRATVNTMEWLEEYKVPYDSITFSRDKTIVKNDIFIEDNMDNFKALWDAGIDCFLMNRAWNAELKTLHRVFGWDDFYRETTYYDR